MTATRRVTLVWVLLLALTFGSFLVGVEQGAGFASVGAAIIVGIAMLKVRLIGLHFMDVRAAPRALRHCSKATCWPSSWFWWLSISSSSLSR